MSDDSGNDGFPWRAVILGPLSAILFVLALYLYNTARPRLGILLLGLAFAIPMLWVVLAARDAHSADTPLRRFIPRMTIWLVLGASILGSFWWNVDRRITFMEMGFAAFYIGAAAIAMRTFTAKAKRPQLTAMRGGKPMPRQPQPQRKRSR
jgi:hypothetical protein